MTLDSLLNSKPVKFVKAIDREVLRQYSKIAKKWEDKGRNIYHLSSAVGLPGIILTGTASTPLNLQELELVVGAFGGLDTGRNLLGLAGMVGDENIDNKIRVRDSLPSTYTNPIVRLPLLVSAVGLLGKVGYDIYNSFFNGEPMPAETADLAELGLGYLGLASSMYLKERDPKLLQKQPFWKTAYEKAKEKVAELGERARDWIPQPVPEPIPIRNYETLEDYV